MLSQTLNFPERPGDHRHTGNLVGCADSAYIADVVSRHTGTVLVIADGPTELDRLAGELAVFRGQEDWEILSFPDWETLPYDNFSPHEDIISERLRVLNELAKQPRAVCLTTAANLSHRLPPHEALIGTAFDWHVGQTIDIATQRRQLESAGYRGTDTVYEHGEFAVRGSILDIYPMGSERPIRVDLFDDEIETLKYFDPDTQRSEEELERITLLPGREVPMTETGIARFRQAFRERFEVDFSRCAVYQDVSEGIAPGGIEYFLPLFYERTDTLWHYVPEDTLVLYFDSLADQLRLFWSEVEDRYENRRHDITQPILTPRELFMPEDEVFSVAKSFARITLSRSPVREQAGHLNLPVDTPDSYPIDHRAQEPLNRLECFLKETDNRILFCAESMGRREALRDLLARIRITPRSVDSVRAFIDDGIDIGLTVAPLSQGLVAREAGFTLISESQLFGDYVVQQRRRTQARQDSSDQVIKNLTELSIGSPVVHIDHGVGRYQGLETLELDGQEQEFLQLEYAQGSKLYVPVSNLHLISRYSGADVEYAPLHKLGNDRWVKTKRKAAEKIRDTAAELLALYAQREAQEGHTFNFDPSEYTQFAAGFGFEETADQAQAIDAVIHDMKREQPMDRLVCGDVGFGKTEVALRAAFIAAQAGRQVAVLVPTTLLAQQHFENFRDRFADWPVRVEALSRFRSGSETKSIIDGIEDGKVDIVVGTHKLLQKDIKFKDLGLLIIDEEHRFGVGQKEKIKALRANVDILTLTATPIPRTLNMSMSGVRDLSIIATPPARRLSVKTFVREREDAQVKEAILREVLRGGQVYYLHNEVSTIEKTAQHLRELVPEARIVVAHGQMPERQLERIMSDFYHKRFNLLLCTTIIETGIDVPTANTIVIERADRFGLAQLHQLRGRVGRSHHQAYAYLMTPPWKTLAKDAQKRLEAIGEAQDLGAGFTLATHDLEIRGAGELLGDEQSGHIEGIGFSLYLDMLNKAVKAIQSGESFSLEDAESHGPDINLRIPALIPSDYVPDINTRLTLYKRIASAENENELRELQVEMIDRFGLLPDPVNYLFRQTALRQRIEPLGIERLDVGLTGGFIDFGTNTTVDPFTLVQLIQSMPQRFKLKNGTQLRFEADSPTPESRFDTVDEIIKLIIRKPQ
ncbi:transcription-repair coupling factor [Saccharospirillum salsuginis]|uniref:Transcription-repair-coupling factor n=1 Tax=Saccharospirillum salsuginis TaxID=418750 RepID=A0A918K5V6_9GAMM|nr:transcription-repair coupling factor [Saccharospirillum salsuginis]GGX51137.1 transcription-repair-coupling factor [Saccharospirillum salsuginis]